MLPLIYDMISHGLQLAERRDVNTPLVIMQAVSLQLRKFNEKRQQVMNTETTLYAAVLDLLANLSFPMPGSNVVPPQMNPNGAGPQGFISPQMHHLNQQQPSPHMMSPMNQMNPMAGMSGGGPNE